MNREGHVQALHNAQLYIAAYQYVHKPDSNSKVLQSSTSFVTMRCLGEFMAARQQYHTASI